MQERNVLVLVVVLVVATAGAGVAVNALRGNDSSTWRAFNLSMGLTGNPVVGSPLHITVQVQQGLLDTHSLKLVFLSVDMGTFTIQSSTPGSNPWGYPTVWNLTGMDLSGARVFEVNATPTATGPTTVYAMIWVPLGDLGSVSVDPAGHVNPAGVSLMATDSAALVVTA